MQRIATAFTLCWTTIASQATASHIIDMPSENFCARTVQAPPKYLVLHTVGYNEGWVLDNFCKSTEHGGLGVSAHYYIPPAGDKIIRMVNPKDTAYHAGISEWQGEAKALGLNGLNHISIGIEVGCAGAFLIDGQAYYPYSFSNYTNESIEQAISISAKTMKEFGILPQNVVWHSDISPFTVTETGVTFRKTDPGASFPAKHLALHGIGLWPEEDRVSDDPLLANLESLQQALLKIGYSFDPKDDLQSKYTIQAFLMHYAPEEVEWADFQTQKEGLAWDGTITENMMIRATNLATGNVLDL